MMDIVEWLRWNAKEQGSRFGEAADEIYKLRDEIFNLKTEVHFDDQTIKSLQLINERLRETLKFYKCSCTDEQFKTCNEYMCGHKAQAALKEGE